MNGIFMKLSRQQSNGDVPPADRGWDPVEAALLRMLFQQFLPILAGNLAVTSVVVGLLWNHVDTRTIGLWAAAV